MSGNIKKSLGVIDDRAFHPDIIPAKQKNEDNILIALLSNDSAIHSCATKTPIIPATNDSCSFGISSLFVAYVANGYFPMRQTIYA